MRVTTFADVDRALDELRGRLPKTAILNGHPLDDIDLTTSTVKVPHKLGRPVQGYLVVGCSTEVSTETRIVSAAAFSPTTIASWTKPAGTADYYTCNSAGSGINIPLPLLVGDKLVGLGMQFYRGAAGNPTQDLYAAATGAAATAVAPTVAWTNPSASTAWTTLTAAYASTISQANWNVQWVCNNIDDRLRACYVTVESAKTAVWDENDGKSDLATNLHLRASGPTTVSLWVY